MIKYILILLIIIIISNIVIEYKKNNNNIERFTFPKLNVPNRFKNEDVVLDENNTSGIINSKAYNYNFNNLNKIPIYGTNIEFTKDADFLGWWAGLVEYIDFSKINDNVNNILDKKTLKNININLISGKKISKIEMQYFLRKLNERTWIFYNNRYLRERYLYIYSQIQVINLINQEFINRIQKILEVTEKFKDFIIYFGNYKSNIYAYYINSIKKSKKGILVFKLIIF